jgi:hypothetical protein
VQASTTVSVRLPSVSTKQGAISAANRHRLTGSPFNSASASSASRGEPTSVTAQPCA